MSEFKGCRVQLQLFTGESLEGEITHLQGKSIILKSDNESVTLEGSKIKDLKVVELPRKQKKVKKTKNEPKKEQKEIKEKKENNGKKLEEFDFAANLKKFDKKSVFEELEKQEGVYSKKEVNIRNDEMIVADNNRSNPVSANSSENISDKTIQLNNPVETRANSTKSLFATGNGEQLSTCAPVQLVQINNYLVNSCKLSMTNLAECGGVNLSHLILSTKIKSVIMFVGNNNTGLIALVTARYLLRNFSVTVMLFNEKEDEILDEISQEMERFTCLGGKIVGKLPKKDSNAAIIDALQDFDTDFTDLEKEDLKSVLNIVRFINSSKGLKISLCTPTGISASDSGIQDLEEVVFADHIVSLGVVLSSITGMYKQGSYQMQSKHWLVDIGLPAGLKGKLKKFERKWSEGFFEISLI